MGSRACICVAYHVGHHWPRVVRASVLHTMLGTIGLESCVHLCCIPCWAPLASSRACICVAYHVGHRPRVVRASVLHTMLGTIALGAFLEMWCVAVGLAVQ